LAKVGEDSVVETWQSAFEMLPLGGIRAGDRCHDRNILKQ